MIKQPWLIAIVMCLMFLAACSDSSGGMYGTGSGNGGGSPPQQGQVLLGPIIAATVTVREFYDETETALCETTTVTSDDLDVAGTFELPAGCVENDQTLYLLTSSGGADIDSDDDGVLDGPTAVTADIHSVVPGYQLYLFQGWKINQLTENIYTLANYGKNTLGLSPSQVAMTLELASGNHLTADISGNGYLDYADVLQWNPREDKAKLSDDANISEEAFYQKHEVLLNDYSADANLEGTWVVLSYNYHSTVTPVADNGYVPYEIHGEYKEVCSISQPDVDTYTTTCFQQFAGGQLSQQSLHFENGVLSNTDGSVMFQLYQEQVPDYQHLAGQAIQTSSDENNLYVNRLYNAQMIKVAPLQPDIGSVSLNAGAFSETGKLGFYLEIAGDWDYYYEQTFPATVYLAAKYGEPAFFSLFEGSYYEFDNNGEEDFYALKNTLCVMTASTGYCDSSHPVDENGPLGPWGEGVNNLDTSLDYDFSEQSTTGLAGSFSGIHTNSSGTEVGPEFDGEITLSFGFLE